jgi:virginiamycin B lyase
MALDGQSVNFPIPSPYGGVYGITAGSDGAIWFTEANKAKIGRLTLSGSFTEYPITVNAYPFEITSGPDGALWFTEAGGSGIGRITTGGVYSRFNVPTNQSDPYGITVGPDNALWFTEVNAGKIGRITTDGSITEYSIPTSGSYPINITAGPDGALWFTETKGSKIGRITTDGRITEYPLPSPFNGYYYGQPWDITAGPDGALWFTLYGVSMIGRITTDGSINLYYAGVDQPRSIVVGSDNALWFTSNGDNALGRIAVQIPPKSPTNLQANSPTQQPYLNWDSVVGTASYDMYRDGVKISSSATNSYTDTTVADGVHAYYVVAVGSDGISSEPSNTINVTVDATAPAITYAVDPAANALGWNNSPVTATFSCNDVTSGISSCSAPQTESTDGAYSLVGTAIDNAGNSQTTSVVVKIDQTLPAVSGLNFTTNPVATGVTNTLNATLTDNLSGIKSAEYYVGPDPGIGNATPMTVSGYNASASISPYSSPGMYTYFVRTQDNAGNWSAAMPVTLDVYSTTAGYTAGHGFITPNGSTSDPGDNLPSVGGQNVKATLDFSVKYADTQSTTPTGDNTFSWGSGNCKKADNSCFVVEADSLNWLIVPGNDTATFQGPASLSLNGQSLGSGYVMRVSVASLASSDHYLLQVYQPASNPDIDSPIYQASGDLAGGSVRLHP